MELGTITLPTLMTAAVTAVFFTLERIKPGRELPRSRGWYSRSIVINILQLGITLGLGRIWYDIYGTGSIFHLAGWNNPFLEGFVAWFIGTFVFYWWHRLRHVDGIWQVFHQLHHSPSRIEILTSFYKHPVEIVTGAYLSAAIIFPLLGCSLMASFWYNFFAATGEFFYHGNYKSPGWLRYFIQTPELHSIHHQLDVHKYNFSDIPVWDRIFGTYKDTTEFTVRCGFPGSNEKRIGEMLIFRDVYE